MHQNKTSMAKAKIVRLEMCFVGNWCFLNQPHQFHDGTLLMDMPYERGFSRYIVPGPGEIWRIEHVSIIRLFWPRFSPHHPLPLYLHKRECKENSKSTTVILFWNIRGGSRTPRTPPLNMHLENNSNILFHSFCSIREVTQKWMVTIFVTRDL
jgi:hypothetical protein